MTIYLFLRIRISVSKTTERFRRQKNEIELVDDNRYVKDPTEPREKVSIL